MEMQQQLYQRFCRLCREPLSSDKCNLYRAWSLTKVGTLLSDVSGEDLSLEAEHAPQICKKCYKGLNTIANKEEELKRKQELLIQAKDEVSSRLIAARRFFKDAKRSRIPLSPRNDQRSPSTSTPARKRLSHTSHPARCVRDLSNQLHQEDGIQRNILAKPIPTDKWTQTEAIKEDAEMPNRVGMPDKESAMALVGSGISAIFRSENHTR